MIYDFLLFHKSNQKFRFHRHLYFTNSRFVNPYLPYEVKNLNQGIP